MACEVFIEDDGDLDAVHVALAGYNFKSRVRYGSEEYGLPDIVQAWLGMGNSGGGYGSDNMANSLANDNDGGKTFVEIAATIAAEPFGLFE